MKITIYTITDCQFSKQEKEYLSSHGLQFQEKNLETNREFLTEMLTIGGNFAGTPVTKIEKDDGQIVVLKGFTAAEFDTTLGSTQKTPVAAADVSVAPASAVTEPASVVTQAAPVAQVEPVAQPAAPVMPDPAMASVLNTLEQQAAPPAPVAPVTPQTPNPVAPMPAAPVIPDPTF